MIYQDKEAPDYYDEYTDIEVSNEEQPTDLIKHAEEYFRDDYYGTSD
jgi:hypothetical protein